MDRAMFHLLVITAVLCVAVTQDAQPQPPPGSSGVFCDDAVCQVPECHCAMTRPNIPRDQMPQIVFLTFDDAVTAMNIEYYHEVMKGRTNPNGCPISMTFFVSHEYTDYVEVNWLWRKGNEIAVHSISHEPSKSYWQHANYSLWQEEIAGMKEIVAHFGNIPREEITGMRAPLLQKGGDEQFRMLFDEHFEYDCSWPTRVYVPTYNNRTDDEHHALWPYTLDYPSPQLGECHPELYDNCPTNRYPGLWEVPMLDMFDFNGFPCAMVDTCFTPAWETSEDATYNLLMSNFKRHYYNFAGNGPGSREPLGIYTHAAWFDRDIGTFRGLMRFLDTLADLNDVYIVSIQKGLEWVKSPVPLDNLHTFTEWQCENAQPLPNCRKFQCKYMESPLGHQVRMRSCVHCPPQYPWLGNPHGGEIDWDEYY